MNEYIETMFREDFIKLIISNRRKKSDETVKIVVSPIIIGKERMFQFERFSSAKVFHENRNREGAVKKVLELLNEQFRQADCFTSDHLLSLKISKSGKVLFSRRRQQNPCPVKVTHNREKKYILKEGTVIAPLIDLGIFTKEGKIVSQMYDKYRQINRFIEIVDDCIPENTQTLKVVDFGCGKSYLTFILYYYLTEVRGIEAEITGLDLKEEVIRTCNDLAKKYGYSGLSFFSMDIKDFRPVQPVDMIVSLHACDTATDYVLYHAIRHQAKIILSSPCCQHEVNAQLNPEHLSILSEYGIIQERFSALLTDAIRGNILKMNGYKTQLLEFVDLSHSPKNILIRSIRSNISPQKKQEAKQQIERALAEFQIRPALYRMLYQKD